MKISSSTFFIAAYIFSGAVTSFYQSLFILFNKKQGSSRFTSAALFAVISLLLFEHIATHFNFIPYDFIHVSYSTVVFTVIKFSDFLIGPLLYITLTDFLAKKLQLIYVHFIPYMLSFTSIFFILLFRRLALIDKGQTITLLNTLDYLSQLQLILYSIYIIFSIVRIFPTLQKKYQSEILILNAILGMLIIFSIFSAYIIGSGTFDESYALCIVITILYLTIGITNRTPELFNSYKREFRRGAYKQSMLKCYDKTLIKARLLELMNDESLYMDEDLSLKKLAGHLELNSHQLSEFLNIELKQSFSSFINGFRIEEVKRQILEHPKRSLLDIAFSSGFNSKTTFNTAFKKSTGISPREYKDSITPHLEPDTEQ